MRSRTTTSHDAPSTEDALHALVRDHFAILKVGPAATFAYREALFALAAIEDELLPEDRSQLVDVLDHCMVEHPKYWQNHYHGDEHQRRLLRRYSLSDRCRYYWGEPEVQAAVDKLVANLRRLAPPAILLSQYLPEQHHGRGPATGRATGADSPPDIRTARRIRAPAPAIVRVPAVRKPELSIPVD